MLYSFVLAALVALFWKYSRFSLQVRAIGSSQQGASFAGLPTNRIKFIVFVLAGMFSGGGGNSATRADPYRPCGRGRRTRNPMRLPRQFWVAAGSGGGKGSMVGTFLGALLLTMIFSGIAGMGLTAAWQLLTKGMILVAVILFMRK